MDPLDNISCCSSCADGSGDSRLSFCFSTTVSTEEDLEDSDNWLENCALSFDNFRDDFLLDVDVADSGRDDPTDLDISISSITLLSTDIVDGEGETGFIGAIDLLDFCRCWS